MAQEPARPKLPDEWRDGSYQHAFIIEFWPVSNSGM